MGARYLTDLADVCRRTGYPVIEVDGWQTRGRGSGGYDAGRPNHVMVHHTASGPGSDGWPDVNYCTFGDDAAPLCNLYLSRVPEIYVCAAGATNTNGSGRDPCGITPDDSMNSHAVGIEAANNGTGEAWPALQQAAYRALCASLCDAYGIAVAQIHAHFEWAPSRKIDPAGPSDYAVGSASWNMATFRADVGAITPGPTPPDPGTPTPPDPWPAPGPDPIPTPGDDEMLVVALDKNGTAWVGNGITRIGIPNEDTFFRYVLVWGAIGRFVNVSGAPVNDWGDVGAAVDAYTLNALGQV